MSTGDRAFFDWAAGAPLHPSAEASVRELLAHRVGNPSSTHTEGRAARAWLEAARRQVAAFAGAAPRDVVFTGSGSEANATALFGAASVFVAATAHPSLRLAAARAAGGGVLPVDRAGRLDPAAVEAALAAPRPPGRAVLAIGWVNHETGGIEPPGPLAALARSHGAELHVDAVQAAGRLPLGEAFDVAATVALSAHKLGGLPGAGALLVHGGPEAALVPGHQERGRRGGTPDLAALAAFGAVCAAASDTSAAMRALDDALAAILAESDPTHVRHGSGAARAFGIASVAFPGADGELLLTALDLGGVAASHGAACSSGAHEPSEVLRALGLPLPLVRASIRLSLGPRTSAAELALLERALPVALRAARAV